MMGWKELKPDVYDVKNSLNQMKSLELIRIVLIAATQLIHMVARRSLMAKNVF